MGLKPCVRQVRYEVGTGVDLLQILGVLVRFIHEHHGLIKMEPGYAFGVFSRLKKETRQKKKKKKRIRRHQKNV